MAALMKRISQHEKFQPKKQQEVIPKEERLVLADSDGNKIELPKEPKDYVVICIDYVDSEESQRVIEHALKWIVRPEINLLLISDLPDKVFAKDFEMIEDMNPFDVTEELRLLRRLREKRGKELLEVAKRFKPHCKTVDVCLSHEERPIVTIMHAIDLFKPGLVVLGKREIKTTMDRWLSTSSVSAHLLVHSPSPVLVVK